jgi:hypothetical protein
MRSDAGSPPNRNPDTNASKKNTTIPQKLPRIRFSLFPAENKAVHNAEIPTIIQQTNSITCSGKMLFSTSSASSNNNMTQMR